MTETWPKAIEAYKTSDGEIYTSRATAEHYQGRLDAAVLANKLLDEGASLGAALRIAGFVPVGCYPELDEVYQSTKLVIEHWQCRSQPGYSPRHVSKHGDIWVFGDAGSWSRCYGADVSATDVVRYWLDTKRRAKTEVSP